jgi:hypothetical protein
MSAQNQASKSGPHHANASLFAIYKINKPNSARFVPTSPDAIKPARIECVLA